MKCFYFCFFFPSKKSSSLEDEAVDDHNIFRQTSIIGVGHFKYFVDNHVQIKFSNNFILNMTPEQVHLCQVSIK